MGVCWDRSEQRALLCCITTGDRLKEATKINLSLSALGNVISALVDGKSGEQPVAVAASRNERQRQALT
jgi:hypothetical protein